MGPSEGLPPPQEQGLTELSKRGEESTVPSCVVSSVQAHVSASRAGWRWAVRREEVPRPQDQVELVACRAVEQDVIRHIGVKSSVEAFFVDVSL